MNYFHPYYRSKILIAFMLTVVATVVLLRSILPTLWMVFSIFSILLFFFFGNKFSHKTALLDQHSFVKQLFYNSLLIRTVWVLFSYYFFIWQTGEPFEFVAADAKGYHNEALYGIRLIKSENLGSYFQYMSNRFSDMGYSIYLIAMYSIFGDSIIVIRLIKAILSSFTCVLIYRIARRNFGEDTGRTAGILIMLLPNLIYYCGLHVKETEMVFIVVAFFERADFLIRNRNIDIKNTVLVVFLNSVMYTFRSVMGSAALVSLLGALIFSSKKLSGWNKRISLAIWICLLIYVTLFQKINTEIEQYWEQRNNNLTSQMEHFANREGANSFARYGKTVIFAPMILFAPFPTLVNIEGQENQMMLAGAYFTRNIFAYFVVIALIAMYREKLIRQHLLILIFCVTYLGILANSGFALSERFHLPVIPFLLILTSFGLSRINQKNVTLYVPYLFIISLIIIGWNWFKLAGRGIF